MSDREGSAECPVCCADIDVVFQFTSHYDDWSGTWEGDVEFVGDPACPNECDLSRRQWDDILVAVSERCE